MKVVVRLVIAIVVALVLLGLWLLVTGFAAGSLGEAARQLFLFMDIGLGVWLVLLIVGARRGWGTRALLASAVVGVVANLLTVTVVGLVQTGAVPWEFMGWALQAGAAFVVGAVVAVLVVKPQPRASGAA